MADEITTEADEAGTPPADEASDADVETPSTEDEAADETPSEAAPTDPAPTAEPVVSKALAKHKGDPAALDKHYFEVQAQNARMAARLKELEAKAGETPSSDPEPEETPEPVAPPEPAPDLKAIDDAIGALTTRLEAIPGQQSALLKEMREAEYEVRDLEKALANTADYEKGPIEAQLKAARLTLKTTIKDYDALTERKAEFQERIDNKKRDRVTAEREVGAAKARQQQAEREAARIRKEYPATVNAMADEAVSKASKVPVTDDMKAIARDLIAGRVSVALWRSQDDTSVVPAVIAEAAELLAKYGEASAKAAIAHASKAKVATARVPGKPTAGSSAAKPLSAMTSSESPSMQASAARLAALLGG